MPGFDPEKHGVSNDYLAGGTFAAACKLTEVTFATEPFEQGIFTFANNEGITQLKLSVPDPKKPFKGKTLAETKKYLDGKFSNIVIYLAKELGILKDLPKTDLTHRQCVMIFDEHKAKYADKKFWVKISKNSRGFSEVGQDMPFLQAYIEGQPCTLTFSKYEEDLNKLTPQSRNTTTKEDDDDDMNHPIAQNNVSDLDSDNPFLADDAEL